MAGSNITDMDPVKAFGNRSRGSTIPHKTPYKDRAFEADKPYFSKLPGNKTVSMLAKRFTMMRFILIMTAILIMSLVSVGSSLRKGICEFGAVERTDSVKNITDNSVEAPSPIRSPVAAMLKGGVCPFAVSK